MLCVSGLALGINEVGSDLPVPPHELFAILLLRGESVSFYKELIR